MRFLIGSLMILLISGCQANIKAKATGTKEGSPSATADADNVSEETGNADESVDAGVGETVSDPNDASVGTEQIGPGSNVGLPAKLALSAESCIDPDLNSVAAGTKLTLCDGSEGTGLLVLPVAPTICAGDGSENCLLTGSMRAVSTTGLGAKVISGQSVAGVNGTVTVPGAAEVKNGVNFGAGNTLIGTYPSASNPLAGADATQDLTASTFLDKIIVTANFEYFDSQGNRHVSSGDGDISAGNISSVAQIFGVDGSLNVSPDPWDVRHGVVVGATTGKLKVNCRSLVNGYDKTNGLAASGPDIYDTVEDGDSSFPPSSAPWNNDAYFCGFNDPTDPSWERVSPATVTGYNSIFKDKISGLKWSRGSSTGTKSWDDVAGGSAGSGALEYCDGLTHGAFSNWRLPTQKEWYAAIAHGIMDLSDSVAGTGVNSLGPMVYTHFWSLTSAAGNPGTDAWRFTPYLGSQTSDNKGSDHHVLCVAD